MSEERKGQLNLIREAMDAGARQSKACEVIGISAKTMQRWETPGNDEDGRPEAIREPANMLTHAERRCVVETVNRPEFANLSASQIVPKLADLGIYIASESSFYRIMRDHELMAHRLRAKPARKNMKPKALTATGPNQVYSWDITYLYTQIKGIYNYLYLVMDVFSRKIVGWQVHEQESCELAADLMTDICNREGIEKGKVTLHSDNGGPMKGATMISTLQDLGVIPSLSRPSVSNDNPYSESLFRTLKYRPNYPEKPFESLVAARNWVQGFVDWYNKEHRHSSIRFVTPEQRHNGEDVAILAKRHKVYLEAKAKNPTRWSGDIRNWTWVAEVYLNPEKGKSEKKAA